MNEISKLQKEIENLKSVFNKKEKETKEKYEQQKRAGESEVLLLTEQLKNAQTAEQATQKNQK